MGRDYIRLCRRAIRRTDVIRMIGAVALFGPLAAQAKPAKVPRIGILTPAATDRTLLFDAFREGLHELGYVEDNTIVLDFALAKGDLDRLPSLAADLVRARVDVIVTDTSTSTMAAMAATRTIPIVIAAGGDPVGLGMVASIARPGGNVTGMTLRTTELSGKRLQLLKEAFPAVGQVAVLMNPRNQAGPSQFRIVEGIAPALHVRLTKLTASSPDELRALRPASLANADGFLVLADAVFWNQRDTIIALAAAARVPAIYPEREYADDGGLIAYGPNVPALFRRAASYVDRILRGAKPGDLPIEEPSKFDFVVNLKTGRALGLSLSQEILVDAGEIIE
jgi:putative tryptophan/tyrosine transport system substrate-binding protein